MPGWRDFLDRFRPAGAPGAASAGAIPIDRAAAAAAELMPLLERLDTAQDEVQRLRAAAREQAAQVRLAGGDEAAAVIRHARDHAETVATQLVSDDSAAGADRGTASGGEGPADGRDAAAELTRRAEERLPDYVDQVVAGGRGILADLCAPVTESTPR